MVGMTGFEPARLSLSVPNRAQYQIMVYIPFSQQISNNKKARLAFSARGAFYTKRLSQKDLIPSCICNGFFMNLNWTEFFHTTIIHTTIRFCKLFFQLSFTQEFPESFDSILRKYSITFLCIQTSVVPLFT